MVPRAATWAPERTAVRAVLRVVAIAGVAASTAGAQNVKWRTVGGAREDRLGTGVSYLSDVDGDGKVDLLIGSPGSRSETTGGAAGIYSGATGVLLREWIGDVHGDLFGTRVADIGDIDGDGIHDVAVTAPNRFLPPPADGTGALLLYSGATGALLGTFQNDAIAKIFDFGTDVAGIGDVDGDGIPDFVSSYTDARFGEVVVVSGATGATIRVHTAPKLDALFGRDLAAAGDVDHDGVTDYVVAAPLDSSITSNVGVAYVYSGKTGSLIWRLTDSTRQIGWAVSGAGDVDRDGTADLLASNPYYQGTFGFSGSGAIVVFSGATGSALTSATGGSGNEIGLSVSELADVDGDGVPDFLASASASPQVRVFSGASGAQLQTIALGSDSDVIVDGAADLSGDGIADILVGDPSSNASDQDRRAGHAFVVDSISGVSLFDVFGLSYSSACGYAMAPMADRDGDGFREVAVGLPGGDGADFGVVRVVSGRDGSSMSTFQLGSPLDKFGHSLVDVGDVDGDLVSDLAVGAPGYLANGRVELHSGKDDSLLASFDGPTNSYNTYGALAAGVDANGIQFLAIGASGYSGGLIEFHDLTHGGAPVTVLGPGPFTNFGDFIACAGDVNGDGIPDWAAGANHTGASWDGSVFMLSGKDGTTVWQKNGKAGEQLGMGLAAITDLDGDGIGDVLAGSQQGGSSGQGTVTAFSGASGAVIFALSGTTSGEQFGDTITALRDLNRDGVADFAVGAPFRGVHGAIDLYSGRTRNLLHRIDGTSDAAFGNLGLQFSSVPWGRDMRVDATGVDDVLVRAASSPLAPSYAELRPLADLFVQVDPVNASPGTKLSVITRGGPKSNLVGLFAVDLDGTPIDQFIGLGTFDGLESFTVSGIVPSGATGHVLTLRAYADGYAGIVESQDQVITFQ